MTVFELNLVLPSQIQGQGKTSVSHPVPAWSTWWGFIRYCTSNDFQHLSKSINCEPKDLKRDSHAKQPCLGKECLQWFRLGAPCAKKAHEDCRLLNEVFAVDFGVRCHQNFLVVIGPLRCRSDWWRRFFWHDNGLVQNFTKGQRQRMNWGFCTKSGCFHLSCFTTFY